MDMALHLTKTQTKANTKTKTKTNTKTKKKTKTKFLKDPTCAIFLKSRGFKDIKYGTHRPHPDRIHGRLPYFEY